VPGQAKQIYNGKVVHLEIVDIQLPDGSTAQREVIRHSGAVAIIALDDQQQVFMVRQYRIGADQHLYEIPAGLLGPGEPPEQAAVRELREETGYRPGTLEALGGFYVAPGYTTEFIHLFIARDLVHDPLAQDKDEFLEAAQIPLKDAIRMIDEGKIVDSKTIIGLLRLARQLDLS